MKKKVVLGMVLPLVLSFTVVAKDIQKVEIQTEMHCNSCKNKIEKTLKNTEGIEKVKADIKTNTVKVEYDKDVISDDEITKKIIDLGYEASKKDDATTKKKK